MQMPLKYFLSTLQLLLALSNQTNQTPSLRLGSGLDSVSLNTLGVLVDLTAHAESCLAAQEVLLSFQ